MRYSATSATVLTLLMTLTACGADSTEPVEEFAAPDVGITLSAIGGSTLSGAGLPGIAALTTNSAAGFLAAQTRSLPPQPVCTGAPGNGTTCSVLFEGLNVSFTTTLSPADTLGVRTETTLSGTVDGRNGAPGRRLARNATMWFQSLTDRGGAFAGRTISMETGTTELLGGSRAILTDTGSSTIRFVLSMPQNGGPSAPPRLVGSSRRVVWTRVPGSAATFWRETTTFDSSTTVRSVIETPAGTKRCSFDMAAPSPRFTCS
jgi:hypothetical protein